MALPPQIKHFSPDALEKKEVPPLQQALIAELRETFATAPTACLKILDLFLPPGKGIGHADLENA